MINKKKVIKYAIYALLFISGAFFVYSVADDYIKVKSELAESKRNEKAYVSIINKSKEDKRVLELNRDDLRHSKDSVIVLLEKARKSLKTPANKPGDVSVHAGTTINVIDTVEINNPDSFKLDTTVIFNEQTKNRIKIEKSKLIDEITVNNSIDLFVYSKREYVNEYDNGWQRFWHFDWKKENVYRYEILNSNNKIQMNDVRVIKVSE